METTMGVAWRWRRRWHGDGDGGGMERAAVAAQRRRHEQGGRHGWVAQTSGQGPRGWHGRRGRHRRRGRPGGQQTMGAAQTMGVGRQTCPQCGASSRGCSCTRHAERTQKSARDMRSVWDFITCTGALRTVSVESQKRHWKAVPHLSDQLCARYDPTSLLVII